MKITVCDVCAAEGKVVLVAYRVGFPGVKLEVCESHKYFGKGMKREELLKEALRLEVTRIKIQ